MNEPVPICAHCGNPQRGYASAGEQMLCHPDTGLDCYRAVTVYGHPMPCGSCAYAPGNHPTGGRGVPLWGEPGHVPMCGCRDTGGSVSVMDDRCRPPLSRGA